MEVQYEKVCALLTDTVMLMCKNGIQFKNELKVQGLIGLTVDKEVYIIQINEILKAEDQTLMCHRSKKAAESAYVESASVASGNSVLGDTSVNDSYCHSNAYDSFRSTNQQHCTEHRQQHCADSRQQQHCTESRQQQHCTESRQQQPVELKKKPVKDSSEPIAFRERPSLTLGLVSSQGCNDESMSECHDLRVETDTGGTDSAVYHSGVEQNSPIDLHVGNRLLKAVDGPGTDDPPDIKPSAGELYDWAVIDPLSLHESLMNERTEDSRKTRMTGREGRRTEILNLKTNHQAYDDISNDGNFRHQSASFKEKKHRPASDDYDYEEGEVSKFVCGLCPASYKHYCNLLTHEVKVHGRQKKKGGRRKKLV